MLRLSVLIALLSLIAVSAFAQQADTTATTAKQQADTTVVAPTCPGALVTPPQTTRRRLRPRRRRRPRPRQRRNRATPAGTGG